MDTYSATSLTATKFKFQSASETEYVFRATLSTIGNVDIEGDRMMPGAFDKFLASARAKRVAMLWQHAPSDVLGHFEALQLEGKRLRATGRMNKRVAKAADAIALIEGGSVDGISIKLRGVGEYARERGDGYTMPIDFKEVAILEASIVATPANIEAGIGKSAKDPTRREAYYRAILDAADTKRDERRSDYFKRLAAGASK